MKKATVILFLLITLVQPSRSQENPFTFSWRGFVNPHYYADSRAVVGGREDMMLFYPKPVAPDSLGRDLNSGWRADMLAITARLGLRVGGPDMLGARTVAYLEGDFTGATNATINTLRLRHAYIDMQWAHHRLLAGQYWHPMVVHEIMPATNPLNMGAPFHPYARQPQLRYTYAHGPVEAIGVAAWQLDNTSQGLLDGAPSASTQYARQSLLPDLTAQLRLRTRGDSLLLGAAANAKTIQPLMPDPEARLHTSLSWSLFGKATLGPVALKAQTLLGNSLYEICSLGGYLMLPDSTFRDWHFNTLWLDLERSRGHWRPGLFLGYARNLDHGGTAPLHVFGRGHDMRWLWRIQPRLSYTTLRGLDFTAEAEYTRAGYAEPVGNLRLSLSMVYAF